MLTIGLEQYAVYSEELLLSALQSILILLIILLFGSKTTPPMSNTGSAQLLVSTWEVKHRLAGTGLFLNSEVYHKLPVWREWAIVSAKRRTIHALHQQEWAWSVLYGYPELLCAELNTLPAPAGKRLWMECDEREWKRLCDRWLARWGDGFFAIAELIIIRPNAELSLRVERWMTEADEFGMMTMVEGEWPNLYTLSPVLTSVVGAVGLTA